MIDNNKYKVIFYDEQENIIFKKEYDIQNMSVLYKHIIKEFGCDDNKPYKELNEKTYGYIFLFDCYGRFEITK